MPKIEIWEPEDPRKIYDSLIQRCKEARRWIVRCYVDDAWVPPKRFPFEHMIKDGIYYFEVVSPTFRQALLTVVDNVPVIKFLDEADD